MFLFNWKIILLSINACYATSVEVEVIWFRCFSKENIFKWTM